MPKNKEKPTLYLINGPQFGRHAELFDNNLSENSDDTDLNQIFIDIQNFDNQQC